MFGVWCMSLSTLFVMVLSQCVFVYVSLLWMLYGWGSYIFGHQQVLKTPYYRNCKSARNIRRGMSFEKEPSMAVRATEGPGHCVHLCFISYCFSSA